MLFSGGCCFILLAIFSALLDTGLPGGWAFPLKVIGGNSIAAMSVPTVEGFASWVFLLTFSAGCIRFRRGVQAIGTWLYGTGDLLADSFLDVQAEGYSSNLIGG